MGCVEVGKGSVGSHRSSYGMFRVGNKSGKREGFR